MPNLEKARILVGRGQKSIQASIPPRIAIDRVNKISIISFPGHYVRQEIEVDCFQNVGGRA
jgi:hypothetical protein